MKFIMEQEVIGNILPAFLKMFSSVGRGQTYL